MAIQKQAVNIPFRQGLDLKTDPYQVEAGKFLALNNSVFDTLGRLTKRNGFPFLTAPASGYSYLNTFKDGLIAIGPNVAAYSAPVNEWFSSNPVTQLSLSTTSLIRNSSNQTQCDSVNSTSGLTCVAYTQNFSGSVNYYFSVVTTSTGQSVLPAANLVPSSSGSVVGSPRVFTVGVYFVVFYTTLIGGVKHLQYIAINSTTLSVSAVTDFTSDYAPASTVAFDGLVSPSNGNLYLFWTRNSSAGVLMNSLSPSLVAGTPVPIDTSATPVMYTVCSDAATPSLMYVTYWSGSGGGGTNIYTTAVNTSMSVVWGPTAIYLDYATTQNLASFSITSGVTVLMEFTDPYNFDSALTNNSISTTTYSSSGSLVSGIVVIQRGAGLASKATVVGSSAFVLLSFSSQFQPTYFFVSFSYGGNGATQMFICSRLAYQNGGGYLLTGLPSCSVISTPLGQVITVAYLIKDIIRAVNKTTGQNPNQVPGIYTQTGINLVNFTIGLTQTTAAEIGSNLNINGGFLSGYDGNYVTENNFFLYPDSDLNVNGNGTSLQITTISGGSIQNDRDYQYAFTFEYTDLQGNQFISAPSVPIPLKRADLSSGKNTAAISLVQLRLTLKTIPFGVTLGCYRWSTSNPVFYKINGVFLNTSNNTLTINDTAADSSIIGNEILYTTGGVLEDVGAPACTGMTLFDDRLWIIDAEDQNLLWFSKQVIENTPVEMSDLLTYYVAPTIGGQGPTGHISCLAAIDDKLIVFKSNNAIYYINGAGPDNTGANGQYSQPIFITSPVGCNVQKSITQIPQGIMFQAAGGKGIWLLGRDLTVKYIGADVESYNSFTVTSALTIPATNQVRFTLSNGTILIYDYYVDQWGTFTGVPGASGTIYKNLHTTIDSSSVVHQESPGVYYDGTSANPVLMSFQTSWLRLDSLRGYQRAYFFFLLGTYLSSHTLQLQIAYDYDPTIVQTTIFDPSVQSLTNGQIEQFRCFLERQRCKAIQLTLTEVSATPGAGLTISGLNFQIGFKKSYAPTTAIQNID
jgi:hypothetical protein